MLLLLQVVSCFQMVDLQYLHPPKITVTFQKRRVQRYAPYRGPGGALTVLYAILF